MVYLYLLDGQDRPACISITASSSQVESIGSSWMKLVVLALGIGRSLLGLGPLFLFCSQMR
jgi:hypothetical protein